jgi:hypothetical protein
MSPGGSEVRGGAEEALKAIPPWTPTQKPSSALEAASARCVPAGDQGHPGRGQGHLDDERDPVDPRVSPTPSALAMSDPIRAATMPITIVSQIDLSA